MPAGRRNNEAENVRKLCERKQSRWVAAGGWTALRLLAAAVLVVSGVGRTFAAPIAPGDAQQIASVDGVELPVFTYRPSGCEPRLLPMLPEICVPRACG